MEKDKFSTFVNFVNFNIDKTLIYKDLVIKIKCHLVAISGINEHRCSLLL